MSSKTFIPEGETLPTSQIGATLDALATTIASRRDAGEESYTYRLLNGNSDGILKKVMEEAGEVALAAKDVDGLVSAAERQSDFSSANEDGLEDTSSHMDAAIDHLRYEVADVVYHLLVVLERYGVGIDEFAAELNNRMTDEERPEGAIRLMADHVNRG